MEFQWSPNAKSPAIEPHSKAKLAVLRDYLHHYFNILNANPNRDMFKLDLIDGFAGGGTFLHQGITISGTPLIMLEEAKAAETRLNKNRKKELTVDCQFYFVDKEKNHTDHLNKVLKERGYKDDDKIIVRNGLFEEEIDAILQEIKRRQPRSGRSIFLLDQTGYSQVSLQLVRRIFDTLANAEIILTFAVDALLNYLHDNPQFLKAIAPIELDHDKLLNFIAEKDGSEAPFLIQRMLSKHLIAHTDATFYTPFFICPLKSRRSLWLLHLSNHHKARDVMIHRHWDIQNTFEHFGTGGFRMLGFDPIISSNTIPLFDFSDLYRNRMLKDLKELFMHKLYPLISTGPITVDAMHCIFANQTAAKFLDLDEVVLQLFKEERELIILAPDGRERSRVITKLQPNDRIALSPQRSLF